MQPADAQSISRMLRCAVKRNRGTTVGSLNDFQLMPAESIGNMQGFEDRFFGRKARGVVLTWTRLAVTVATLLFGEDARFKATVTTRQRPLHSRDQA